MSELLERLKADQIGARRDAMKASEGDKPALQARVGILTMAISEGSKITAEESKKGVREPTDAMVIRAMKVLSNNIKLALDGDPSKAESRPIPEGPARTKLELEKQYLSHYIPEVLDEPRLRLEVGKAADSLSLERPLSIKNMKVIMDNLNASLPVGTVDQKIVSEILKSGG